MGRPARSQIPLRVADLKALERLRLRKGASIDKLAELSGISANAVGRACRGGRISAESWSRIYEALRAMPDLPGFELLVSDEEKGA